MATITTLIDDLDGSRDSVETRHFALGSTSYSIDLSAQNFAALCQLLEPYVRAATVTSGRSDRAEGRSVERRVPTRAQHRKVTPVYGDGKAIKAFAAAVGAPVPYARPTNELVRQWVAAHPDETRAWEAQTGLVALKHYA